MLFLCAGGLQTSWTVFIECYITIPITPQYQNQCAISVTSVPCYLCVCVFVGFIISKENIIEQFVISEFTIIFPDVNM